MRVIQVLAGAAHGGAETAFEDIVLALSSAGLHQKVVTRANNPERIQKFMDAGLEVETLPFGGAVDFYTPWKLKKIIAGFKPHIVQTWMSRATRLTPNSRPPKTYMKVARLGGYYDLKYFKGTDYYVANTPDIKKYLMGEGVLGDRIATINNFAEEEKSGEVISRKEMNTPDDATVILSLARYHPVKALDILIQAVSQIENVHVWLAGEGPQRAELVKLAADIGVSDRIHFLGWRTDRVALLQAADICVFPSRYEPFGTVFVQAWAQKIPLICSRSQGPSQYIRHGEDALMFDIDDVSQLVAAIRCVMNDKGLADRLVEAGYQRFKQEFTREKIVTSYIAYYTDILAREGIAL